MNATFYVHYEDLLNFHHQKVHEIVCHHERVNSPMVHSRQVEIQAKMDDYEWGTKEILGRKYVLLKRRAPQDLQMHEERHEIQD